MSTCDAMGSPICSCLLCKTEAPCMDIFGADGIASNISEIVQLHFEIQILLDDDHKSSHICFKCWTITENFHNLYLIVCPTENMLSQQVEWLSRPMTVSGMIEPALDAVVIKNEPLDRLSDGIAVPPVDPQPSINLPKFEIVVLPEMSHDAEITIKNEPIIEDDDHAAPGGDALSEDDDDDDDGPHEKEMATVHHDDGPPTRKHRHTIPNNSNENTLIRQYFNMNCEMCTESFDTIRDSMHHYRRAHKRTGFVRCCGRKYSNRAYALDHLKVRHNVDCFRCEPCGIRYDSKVELCCHETETIRLARIQSARKQLATIHSAATTGRRVSKASKIVNKDSLDELIRKFCSMSCELCTDTFQTLADAKLHYRQEHDRTGYIRCCRKKIFQTWQAWEHLSVHIDPDTYRCDTCRRSFLTKDGMQIHIRSFHSSPTTADQKTCSVCDKVFLNKYFYYKHIRAAHPKGAPITSSDMADNDVENESSEIKEEIIDDDEEAATTNRMETSTIINPSDNEDISGEASEKETEHALILKYISLRCVLCPESFDSVKMLFSHFRQAHHQQGYINCCKKKFNRRASILDHAQYHHDPRAFWCKLCCKSYISGVSLRVHIRARH